MLESYRQHVAEREAEGLPPLALDANQVADLVELIKNCPTGEEEFLLDLLINRVPPGVDQAAYVKAAFLSDVAKANTQCDLIDAVRATEILGTMLGGYNIQPLIDLLDLETTADAAAKALSHTLLVYDAFHDIAEKSKSNDAAASVVRSWADAEWFTSKPELAKEITVTVYKVPGETNTDDLSPATEAWSRPDIPLHAKSMLITKMDDPLETIEELKKKGFPIAYVGDVVGTGSSRKSAINSVLWHMGNEIPFVPNKHEGGVVLGSKIAPIFFNTAEDSGALPIECDVDSMQTGDVITIRPFDGVIVNEAGDEICKFDLNPATMADEVRANGRIPLIIGRGLTDRARNYLGEGPSDVFLKPQVGKDTGKGFTHAQKIVGRACGVEGIRPGTYCEPKMTTVGSQDTTGAMTRDELKELACLGFSADLVMQSFCHTAAYPKPVDIKLQHELPDFMQTRAGVALRPGDGIIHSWMNRFLVPDTLGTAGDSHTRFPIGLSFPAGSGLVAFAGALGFMPLDMPDSVLVKFMGELNPGITLRDVVNAIPYFAIQEGLLTVAKEGKKNIFNGRIIEMEGLPNLEVEQAFELTNATAERSAAGGTVALSSERVSKYLRSNIALMKRMIKDGYQDANTLQRRIEACQEWLEKPALLRRDDNAKYTAVLEINLANIREPIVACPNDPDDVRLLSDVSGDKIDEIFIGSCMTNIGHFRAAGKIFEGAGYLNTRIWLTPPTKMDRAQLMKEGYYSIYSSVGARTEIPGCSLCMGNQARVRPGVTIISSSTRNFDNRMGDKARVYLGSAELAAVAALSGKLPKPEEYFSVFKEKILPHEDEVYRYHQFDEMENYL